MDAKELQTQLEQLKTDLEKAVTEKNKPVIEEIQKKLSELKEVATKYEEQQKKIEKLEKDAEANQKALDKLIAKGNDINTGGNQAIKTLGGEMYEELTKRENDLKQFKEIKKGFGTIELKTVANMAVANLTGTLPIAPNQIPGVVTKLYEQNHVRDFISVGQTNSPTIRYIQDNGGEGGPTTVAEGAAKPQIDRDLAVVDAPVRKIATYFRVSEEMIADIPYISSFLQQVGIEELRVVEDNQLLYGDGTGTNISGFNVQGTAFAAGSSVIGASSNNFDVIGAAKKQIRVAKINGPFVALINPVDYFDMRYKTKDTTNNYIFQAPSLSPLNQPLNADGVQISENNSVTAGTFFVFTPLAAQIFERAGLTVRFYDQDQDNAIKNLITIVIEERIALAVYRTAGIIRGTFSTAITDLTS
jgi:HK97 family phage major capsid protein